jgi:hypothetical protein
MIISPCYFKNTSTIHKRADKNLPQQEETRQMRKGLIKFVVPAWFQPPLL